MAALPSGTVTFFLSDIEDSSVLWERDPESMRVALASHDALIGDVIGANGGEIVKHMGDGCWAAFASAPDAARAAVEFLRRLQTESDQPSSRLKVRIGLHTGAVSPTDGDYFGPVPNRAARVAGLGNGNQIVCSAPTAALLDGMTLRSEGRHDLRGIGVEEIFVLLADGLEIDPRPLRAPVAPANLPRARTSFVGRAAEVDRIVEFLTGGGRQLVTLVGPGGIGKTRLAIESGGRLTGLVHGTVLFCDLGPVSEPEQIVHTVAEVVGARQQPGMSLLESIADHLSVGETLLILDGCEHVVDAARQLVLGLVEVPGVRFIVTSREALGVDGEQLVPVSPLSPEDDGVQLFVHRARQKNPSFELDAHTESDVRDVVRRLDGIPLAIELAAAKLQVMGPAELLARLDDRFEVLSAGRRRDRPETLRDTVAWSYNLLTPSEAALFTRLSVFAGGFVFQAVEDICCDDDLVVAADVDRLLMALVDKSMVVSTAEEGRVRFSLLETLRRFGEEVLGASGHGETFRRRHAAYFAELAATQNERVFSAAEPDAWRILDREWPNLRAARDTLERTDQRESATELVVALVWFATFSMRYEVFNWAVGLLADPSARDRPRYTDLCGAAAIGAYFRVDESVTALANDGLDNDPSDPEGFCRLALAAVFLNNLHTADASDALTSAWLASPPRTEGSRLWAEGLRTFHLCSHAPSEEARQRAEATAAVASRTGCITAKGLAAWAQGMVQALEDRDRALATWTHGLEWSRSFKGDHLVDHLLVGLILHFTVGHEDLGRALRRCRDAVAGAIEAHYHVGTSHLFGVTAIALCRAGDAPTGARLVGAMMAAGHLPRDNARRALERSLGDDLDRHLDGGGVLSVTEAAHLALEALDRSIAQQEELAS